jgi:light-regulated signal transduction histidine kinase (bacteriophytochrome)
MWFRPPKTKEVIWGGNPDKNLLSRNENGRLTPRKSFEKWKQIVENQSETWTKEEIDTAITLRNDVKEFIVKRFYEIKKLHTQLQASYDELESFSYSVSHDLRSPLRAIEGFSQILLEDYSQQLDDYGLEVLNTIVDSINKMNDFVNDILELSKLAKIEMIYNQINVNNLLPSIISDVKNSNNAYEKIHISIEENLPLVPADNTMLKQLFYNIIGNAMKYSVLKNKPVIKIGGREDKNHILFYIEDNGIGLDIQYADKIFDVFSRLVSDDEFEGTGIGLSIVKRIMDRHHGTISVESELEKGTTFWVSFPKVDEENFIT